MDGMKGLRYKKCQSKEMNVEFPWGGGVREMSPCNPNIKRQTQMSMSSHSQVMSQRYRDKGLGWSEKKNIRAWEN